MKHFLPLLIALAAPLAAAHEGHGLTGSHTHATDTWGFVGLGLIVAAAVWFGRRK
jgi:membrane peptidoglycan carboxypeptidase